jgi:predicted nucleic acid-binding protein
LSYLLDTNIVSEVVRPKPDRGVVRWLETTPDSALHLSVLSLGEIRSRAESLKAGARREKLRIWLEQELPAWFEGRLLPVDVTVADRWGQLIAAMQRPVPAIDGLLAATALAHGLRLVTRNVRDFAFPGLEVVNPWVGLSRQQPV